MAFLGVASSGLGFPSYFRLLREIGPVRATSVTFLNPIVATASASVYLGEAVTPRMAAGCAVILAGAALTLGVWPRRAHPPAAGYDDGRLRSDTPR
ncbi:MAG: DMT family transporter [Burkholderiaceae bacterium]|nr:DMT family transporter [Burkholderiales bacterium]MCZ8098423.1 DMT family transporter [Burkholderiales bacterium]MCZ8337189.1 DMT family transporter [Burkholderiaceae bacterium]